MTEAQYKTENMLLLKELGGSSNEELQTLVKKYTPTGNPNAIKKIEDLRELHTTLKGMQKQEE